VVYEYDVKYARVPTGEEKALLLHVFFYIRFFMCYTSCCGGLIFTYSYV